MIQLKLELALAAACAVLGLAALGPRTAWKELGAAFRSLDRSVALALAGSAALLLLALFLARSKVPADRYLASTALGTVAFAGLWLAARRIEGAPRLLRDLAEGPSWAPALLCAVLALLAQQLVLGNVPHVSDEVAYQFQARALAQGRLGFEPPEVMAFFEHVLLTVDGGTWHGIMNPGWPLLLAPGYAIGVPFLVNPLLAAATLPLFHDFLRRAGAGRLIAGLATWSLALSPFYVFLAGTYMAHTAGLFLAVAFLWGWILVWRTASWPGAVAAGAALALGVLVRPMDAAAFALPFGMALAYRALRHRRWLPALLVVGLVGSLGAVGTLAYNRALTGEPLEFPQNRYFAERFPGQGFGLGFGPMMGSKAHGEEWPGYSPLDAPRVTSHRLLQWLRDLWGLPWLTAAMLLLGMGRRDTPWPLRLVVAGGAAVLIAYVAHFYHGIAYGSRHYFLLMALAGLAVGSGLAQGLTASLATRRRVAAAALALSGYVLLFAGPPLVLEYGSAYRMASPSVRRAVATAPLDRALVFVDAAQWGWKSAFPLNELPLSASRVLYARDLGERNAELIRLHPERSVWHLTRERDDSISLNPYPPRGR